MTVELGGTEITPSYAGRSASPGVDQINFQIPDGVLNGCYLSIIVKVGGIESNETTIAKASGPGPCEHPLGLSADDMATLDGGGRILFGTIHLQSDVGVFAFLGPHFRSRFELVSAQFYARDAAEVGLLAQPMTAEGAYLGCHLAAPPGTFGRFFAAGVDAGTILTLTGPERTITMTGAGFYSAASTLQGFLLLVPGWWRIEGPGGRTIGPFEADLDLPPVVLWPNEYSMTSIDRGQDQDIIWNPSGYTDADIVTVSLVPFTPTYQVVCRTPASAGKLTIPASLLAALPPGTSSLRHGIAPLPNRRKLFSLPLTDGSTAGALFDYSFSDTITLQLL